MQRREKVFTPLHFFNLKHLVILKKSSRVILIYTDIILNDGDKDRGEENATATTTGHKQFHI